MESALSREIVLVVCNGWLNGILNVQRDCVGLFALFG